MLDGFDLGVGILFPFARKEEDRDTDDERRSRRSGTATRPGWCSAAAACWVAFPKAYAVIMPALYLPVIVMLLALIFRGVVVRVPLRRQAAASSAGISPSPAARPLAAFAQGIILGGLIQGITVVDGRFAGGPFDWATPFALLCGLGLVAGYALLGATWLIAKTEGGTLELARRWAPGLLIAVLAFIALVSLWTPLAFERIADPLVLVPQYLFLAPVPLLTAALAWRAWRSLAERATVRPFVASVGLFMLCFLGLAISTFPYLVPPTLTVWDTAAAPESQIFSLIGALFMLPILLGYVAFVYWTFRAKVQPGEGYH